MIFADTRWLWALAALPVLALLAYGFRVNHRDIPSPLVNRPAGTFALTSYSGEPMRLEAYRGRVVVVNFWASWCIPCRDEAPVLQQTYERYRDQGLVVLGVDVNDFRQDARRFMRRYGITYPVVYDGKGSTVGKWGVRGFPETFFVDRSGKLVGERISGAVDIERNRDAFERGVALALGDQS